MVDFFCNTTARNIHAMALNLEVLMTQHDITGRFSTKFYDEQKYLSQAVLFCARFDASTASSKHALRRNIYVCEEIDRGNGQFFCNRLESVYRRAGWRLSSVAGNAPLAKSSLFIGWSGVTTSFPRRSTALARFNDALPSGADKTKRIFANSTINSLRRRDAFLVMRFAFVLQ
jgi:hypothetical protein